MEQFEQNPHPNQSDAARLAEITGLTRRQIYHWFLGQQRTNGLTGPVFTNIQKPMKETYPELMQQFKIHPYLSQGHS